jgi:putative redox protein
MEVNVQYLKGMHFVARGANPVDIHMDAKPEFGGDGLGASPMELILMGVAGCSGIDVVSILGKMRMSYDRFELTVDGERAEEHPKVFTTMQIVYKFWGENLEEDKLRKAIDLSLNKYCSVSNTVNKVAKIDYRLELNP